MTIRKKLLLTIGLAVFCLALGVSVIARLVPLRSLSDLEPLRRHYADRSGCFPDGLTDPDTGIPWCRSA